MWNCSSVCTLCDVDQAATANTFDAVACAKSRTQKCIIVCIIVQHQDKGIETKYLYCVYVAASVQLREPPQTFGLC